MLPVKQRPVISRKSCGTGDGWVFLSASAQVCAVGVDQAGAVLRGPTQLVGFGYAGVPFDGVQGKFEAAGAGE